MSGSRFEATAEQRKAQKRLNAYLRTCGYVCRSGVAFWREADPEFASAEDVGADLALLGVPSSLVDAARPPTQRSRTRRQGREARVAARDLPGLVRWLPGVGDTVAGLAPDGPGFNFTFYEFFPDGSGAVKMLRIAASWPVWTANQARRMGLVCAVCDRDLRDRADGARTVAVNRPLPDQRRRLVCETCAPIEQPRAQAG